MEHSLPLFTTPKRGGRRCLGQKEGKQINETTYSLSYYEVWKRRKLRNSNERKEAFEGRSRVDQGFPLALDWNDYKPGFASTMKKFRQIIEK